MNASYGAGKAFGTYASVTATSGLFAGTGGFEVSVGGTTTLMGAALASKAEAARNSLSTAALKTGDLRNDSRWQAESSGFSLSLSTSGIGGLQPGLGQRDSGGASGVATATIAPGRIAILNAELQKQLTGKTPDEIIAGLNRAAEAQNTAAEKLPGTLGETLQAHADISCGLHRRLGRHGQARGRCGP